MGMGMAGETGGAIPILYGSQTGNASHLAGMLADRLGRRAVVSSIDGFSPRLLLDTPFVIFICSTHGNGQCPFNMAQFWGLVCKQLPEDETFAFEFGILGLGDSNYAKYNWCAKMLHNRLKQLGAKPVVREYANSQDPSGMYDGYYRFERSVLEYISDDVMSDHDVIVMPDNHDAQGESTTDSTRTYAATVVSNRLVSAPECSKHIIEVVFDIPGYGGFYPGDCIAITPSNPDTEMARFDYLTPAQRDFLRESIDLTAPPHWPVFRGLSALASDPQSSAKLLEISADYDLYHSYALQPRRSILEILDEFAIRDPPFEFLQTLGRIYPRYYSCSHIGGHYSILVTLAEYSTYLSEARKGLCSKYLVNLSGQLTVQMVRSLLFLDSQKLLFFSTGSGLTLPRSVIHFLGQRPAQAATVRVYHGFRQYGKDDPCTGEFRPDQIQCAASVDDGKYVTDVFAASPVDDIDGWLVFVSGNARLNKSVSDMLRRVYGREIPFQSETW